MKFLLLLILISCGTLSAKQTKPGTQLLVKTERIEEGLLSCESEAGTLLKVGTDSNKNQILDDSEVEETTYICDGVKGLEGEKGADGETGKSGPSPCEVK